MHPFGPGQGPPEKITPKQRDERVRILKAERPDFRGVMSEAAGNRRADSWSIG